MIRKDMEAAVRYDGEPWYDQTVGFAATAHAGQTDKAGEPYIDHLLRTAAHLVELFPDATQDEVEAAVLHDVLEDTDQTEASLREVGVRDSVISIVKEVTRPADARNYKAWISSLARDASVSALRVKLADNTDNRDPERARRANMRYEMTNKYEPAAAVLRAGLEWRAGAALRAR